LSRFGFAEVVAFIAVLTGLNALAIDMMLPALSTMGADLHATSANDTQLVIVVYMFAAGIAQLFYGPLADRFGRRPVLLAALGGYVVSAGLAVIASSFGLLLVARALQGATTAAGRVVGLAVVRDLYVGRRMAEVMSTAMSVFMIAPVVAPTLGELFLFVGPWRGLFGTLTIFGLAVFLWTWLRLPETQHTEDRVKLDPSHIAHSFLVVLRHGKPMGYIFASTVMFSALMAYLSSAQQVFTETFHLGKLFPVAFGAVALSLAGASILNARIVGRYGMHRISHIAMIAFAAVNLVHALVAAAGAETIYTFMGLQMLAFFTAGLTFGNFSSIALEPLGRVAGVASSVLGFVQTSGSAVLGGLIGQLYDGTTKPLTLGMAAVGLGGLLIVLVTERGKLFHGHPIGRGMG
jgi:DHA1 family bicyclomycin/chloramphenicol resistance-like MFS transporter